MCLSSLLQNREFWELFLGMGFLAFWPLLYLVTWIVEKFREPTLPNLEDKEI